MFDIDGTYANRRGTYKVLSINGPMMSIEYEDGSTAEVKIAIQQRIWENIQAERELREKRSSKRTKRRRSTTVKHFVKLVNAAPGEELTFPGWEERVVLAPTAEQAAAISKGDRLIYFSPEAMTFFAVATITGDAFEADPKKYTYAIPEATAIFFQIDRDADTGTLERGVTLDSVELESNVDLSPDSQPAETFIAISEDDFELLSEILTEISEDEEDEDDLDEDDEFDEDEE